MKKTSKNLAVLSVIGKDQKGVVARVSTYLADQYINIEDIEQKVVEGLFIMTMLLDLSDISVSLDELVTELLEIGREINMEIKLRLHSEKEMKNVAIFVSFEPQCLETLIKYFEENRMNGKLCVILSNHDKLEHIAKKHNIPFFWHPSKDKSAHEDFLLEKLKEYEIDVIALARYMQILTKKVVEKYPMKIINIHPSLLPCFPGANAYKQAYENGVKIAGCTAHFVTEKLDEGPVILQDVFHIKVGEDTYEDVKYNGQKLEGDVIAEALRLLLNDQLVVDKGKVIFKPGLLISNDCPA